MSLSPAPEGASSTRVNRPTGSSLKLLKVIGRVLLAVIPVAAVVLVVLAPKAAGVSWNAIGASMLAVGPFWLLAMTLAWAAGLFSYGLVMVTALPGLSMQRAVSLNMAGSATANSLPLGGALSYGLTTAMARSWGFTSRSIGAFFTVTTLANLAGRLLFGALALFWFVTIGPGLVAGRTDLIVAGATAAVLALTCTVLASRRVARALRVDHYRETVVELARVAWRPLSLGMCGYIMLLGVLLDVCMRGLGSPRSFLLALAVVGIERLVTAIPITPGGAGAAELSMFACLTAAGLSNVDAVAATALYRIFTFLAEIPIGAAVTIAWQLSQRRLARATPTVTAPVMESIS